MKEGLKVRELISAERIERRIAEIADEISRDYAQSVPLLVMVLKGSFIFGADLARHISIPFEIDFLACSSYGDSTETSGTVRLNKDLDADILGRDVILVEDILDTGLTLNYLEEVLRLREPKSLSVAVFLEKNIDRTDLKLPPVRYVGFEVGSEFVVGYGLDYAQRYRGLPYVGVIEGV